MRGVKTNGLTLLEKGLPIDQLYKLAKREGNSKKPWYRIHKWWARRPGSVFRMIGLALFLKDDTSLRKLWNSYYNGTSFAGKIVLDPFMGGGTTIVESLRLGCSVIGVDVNPVAWFVTRMEVEKFDKDLADKTFQRIEETVGNRIKQLYQTRCDRGHLSEIVHTIWVQRATCPDCGKPSLLLRDHLVRKFGNHSILVCPTCQN